ncbi:hypothetical protein [Microbacterium indicum]|uniref:hypothetical protein n=1 Tax=Microbacterium indicum TaxID=358100 RepID=UPI000405EE78|nr:hypothetical protein [Microbacterium indicum]
MPKADVPVAWVESPLQLIGAAEWAHAHRSRVDVAGRLAVQVEETAAELTRRGAGFAAQAGYWGIPWRALAAHDHWLVGDGFSGQFRLAVAVLRPRRLTFLDDGLQAIAFADALTGSLPYSRPGVAERGLSRRVAPFALDHMRLRAAAGAADVFTAFPLGDERAGRLADLGVSVGRHDFEWLRASAPSRDVRRALAHDRIVLGSANVEDGLVDRDRYLAWVAQRVRGGADYLPHRRESDELLAAVRALPGAHIVSLGLPVELVLAGDDRPRDIVTLGSSAAVTLRRVLQGSGAVVREIPFGQREGQRS